MIPERRRLIIDATRPRVACLEIPPAEVAVFGMEYTHDPTRDRTRPSSSRRRRDSSALDNPGNKIELFVDGIDGVIQLDPNDRPFFLIGRSRDCDLTLPHHDVSHRHAVLQLIGDDIFCVDLMSRNGTWWSDERRRSGWLVPGERISIGPYSITYPMTVADSAIQGELIKSDVEKLNLMRSCDPLDVEFVFLNGRGHAENRWRMNAPVVLVGKSKRCRLSIDHPSVSRVHCSLTATPDGVLIADLLGRGGTWVNQQRITQHILQAGDTVQVGKFRFQVNYDRHGWSDPRFEENPPHPQSQFDGAPFAQQPPAIGMSETAVLAMMDRFSQMQQQMFEMGQQQMMMMAQLVGNMQSSYGELAQQELARIENLGTQIDQLQTRIVESESKSVDSATPAEQKSTNDTTDTKATSQPSTESAGKTSEETQPGGTDGQTEQKRKFSQGDIESHSLLLERMSSLERERKSRWKKLMGLITRSS